ncbi:MAG: hypothetical protein RJA70_608 [Pseudomonadota bacterium]
MKFIKSSEVVDRSIHAKDGAIGKCLDLLFDRRFWTVRYLLVGIAATGRRALVSPISLDRETPDPSQIKTVLTLLEVESGPAYDVSVPVTRWYERRWATHYGYGHYWRGELAWGEVASPWELASSVPDADSVGGGEYEEVASHLRSVQELAGYSVRARDAQVVGQVMGCVLDRGNWTIRYLIVDTGSWLSSRKVLVAPDWIRSIDWEKSEVTVDMDGEMIRNSPPIDGEMFDRECENVLYDYYGRPRYWENTVRHVAR